MAKVEKTTKKRGRPKKIVEIPISTPPEVQTVPIMETPSYKEEIMIQGKKVKRLTDGKDTDLQFHCSVNNGESTGHFDKSLFK